MCCDHVSKIYQFLFLFCILLDSEWCCILWEYFLYLFLTTNTLNSITDLAINEHPEGKLSFTWPPLFLKMFPFALASEGLLSSPFMFA
jgi:hypothetical protein